jgi:mRNA interferase YafQ
MALSPLLTNLYKKYFKRLKQRGKNMDKLLRIVNLLINEEPLPVALHDHPLRGKWIYHRDIHIEPDWILIYKIEGKIRF